MLAWKREVERIKFLEAEKEEVDAAIAKVQAGGDEIPAELEARRKEVAKEMKLKPSLRIRHPQ